MENIARRCKVHNDISRKYGTFSGRCTLLKAFNTLCLILSKVSDSGM